MKKIIFLLLTLESFYSLKAQKEDPIKTDKIFFTSFIGIGMARGDISTTTSSGLQAMTGIEYKFNPYSSVIGELNFDGYSYMKMTTDYSLSGSLNTIPITILYKYTLGKNTWLPYFKTGLGIARVSVPMLFQNAGFTSVNNSTSFALQCQIALGMNYTINKQYLIFSEAAYQQYAKLKVLNNQSLGVSAFRIGISTAL